MAYTAPLEDQFNPDVAELAPETPDLSMVLEQALRQRDLALRVCLPAVVVSVSGVQQVDVQPTLQGRYTTGTAPATLPIIKNVPVLMPSGQTYALKLPISAGDPGMLLFCDRSLDVWTQGTGLSPVDPQDSRAHDLTDPIFLPGLVPFGSQLQDTTSDLYIRCGKSQLRLQPNGTLVVAAGDQELMSLLGKILQNQIDVIDTLATNTYTNTLLGPQPFLASTVAALSKLKSTAQSLSKLLSGITGKQ